MSIVVQTRPGSGPAHIRSLACVAVSVPPKRQGERVQKEITAILTEPVGNEFPKLEIVADGRKWYPSGEPGELCTNGIE
jgi:hypothetical protein